MSRTAAASTSGAAGYQRPARCGSLMRGTGPAGSLTADRRSRARGGASPARGSTGGSSTRRGAPARADRLWAPRRPGVARQPLPCGPRAGGSSRRHSHFACAACRRRRLRSACNGEPAGRWSPSDANVYGQRRVPVNRDAPALIPRGVPGNVRSSTMARPQRAGMLRRILAWSMVAMLLAAGIGGFVVYREVTTDLPPVDQLLRYQPPVATRIFADDGTLVGEFYVERRYLVPLASIPPHVRMAFLAAEDADFYRHHGVNPLSILRALMANVLHHQVVQGGSTITQQVVKALLLSPERSYERKVKELVLAFRLEPKLSKDDILYLSLSQISFGAGAYGVAAAAREFFDTNVEDLTIAQAAVLAGLPQAPSRYDPQRHPQHAVARQHYVLQRMRENGFITPAQQTGALAEQLVFAPRRPATYLAAPWYVEHVRRLLEERYGGTAPYQLGLQVYTAVDVGMQKAAEEAVRAGLRELDARQGFRGPVRHLDPKKGEAVLPREAASKPLDAGRARGVVTDVRAQGLGIRTAWEKGWLPASALGWGARRLAPSAFKPGDVIAVTVTEEAVGGEARFALDQEPQVEGALAAIDPYTGQVKAMVGGYDFRRSQFNRAVQAKRQPGSAFKPLIYACAIDHGYTPA